MLYGSVRLGGRRDAAWLGSQRMTLHRELARVLMLLTITGLMGQSEARVVELMGEPPAQVIKSARGGERWFYKNRTICLELQDGRVWGGCERLTERDVVCWYAGDRPKPVLRPCEEWPRS